MSSKVYIKWRLVTVLSPINFFSECCKIINILSAFPVEPDVRLKFQYNLPLVNSFKLKKGATH